MTRYLSKEPEFREFMSDRAHKYAIQRRRAVFREFWSSLSGRTHNDKGPIDVG